MEFEDSTHLRPRCSLLLIIAISLNIISCIFVFMREQHTVALMKMRRELPHYVGLLKSGRVKTIILECLLALITPYPFLIGSKFFYFNELIKRQIYYNWNDFLQLFVLMRFVYIATNFILTTVWNSTSAQRIWYKPFTGSIMYGCKADLAFGIKALMKEKPIRFMLVVISFMTTMFSIAIMYAEAPISRADPNFMNLRYLDNCIWLVVITMTTGTRK